MNEGDTWDVRSRAATWRNRAYFAWCEAHPEQGPSGRRFADGAAVFVTIPFKVNRGRDPINYTKTVKHIVDGLVLAGAWPDDTPDHVTQHVPALMVGDGNMVRVRVTKEQP